MGFADMGAAFIKPTALAIRQYMRAALQGGLEQYDRVVLPLAGRFQLAECAVDAGWRTGEIQCADTNLFSSLLGYMAAGKDIDELGIGFEHDTIEAEWARAKFDGGNPAAAVFMMLKLAALRPAFTTERLIRAELWANRDHYGNQFQANAMRLAEKLRGLDYHVADVFAIASEAAADVRALLYVDPGKLIGKPFEQVGEPGAWISWNKPLIAPFESKTGMAKLHHDLMPAAALAFFHWHAARVPDAYKERSVYVVERNATMREHILCNRPDEARRLVKPRGETEIEPSSFPMLPAGHVVKPDSRLEVLPTSKACGLYYTDLWGVRTKGRIGQCFLVLLDGYLAAVFGVNFADIRMSRGPWITVTFVAYPPDGEHVMDVLPFVLTSQAAWKVFEGVGDAPLYELAELRITLQGEPANERLPRAVTAWKAAGLGIREAERMEDGTDRFAMHGMIAKWKNDAVFTGQKQRISAHSAS